GADQGPDAVLQAIPRWRPLPGVHDRTTADNQTGVVPMIRTMYIVYPHDSVHQAFVLKRMDERRLMVMEAYQDLVCQKCGKVNEMAALARGIQAGVVVKSKRPFLGSADNFYLVDERGKEAFSAVVPERIDYYQIPSSAFYVACAKIWFEPEES